MKNKLLSSLICLMAIAIPVNARTVPQHSAGASWSYFGFNSTYSKNSEKQTFGTFGLDYECRFNKWIAASGRLGWSHSWFRPDADPAYAYPKKDNAIVVLAGCDVTWFRKGMIELHSEVAAGQFDAIGFKLNWNHAYRPLTSLF